MSMWSEKQKDGIVRAQREQQEQASKRTGIRNMYGNHQSVTRKAQTTNRNDKQDEQPEDTESIHLNAPNQHRPNTWQPIIMVTAVVR